MCEIIKALFDVAFLVSANFGLHISLPFPLPPEFFDSDRTWSSSMHGFSTRLKCNLIHRAYTDLLGVLSSLIYAPMVWHSIRMNSLNLDRGVVCQEQSDYTYGYDTERRVGWFCRHSHAQTWYKPNPDVSYDSRFPMCVCIIYIYRYVMGVDQNISKHSCRSVDRNNLAPSCASQAKTHYKFATT